MTDPDAPRPLTGLPVWSELEDHAAELKNTSMRALFEKDPGRFDAFCVSAAGLLVDYSKNLITSKTRDLLLRLAHARGLNEARAAMFEGAALNTTEDRAVLHVALRADPSDTYRLGHVPARGEPDDGESEAMNRPNVPARSNTKARNNPPAGNNAHTGSTEQLSGRDRRGITSAGRDILEDVFAVKQKMRDFCTRIHAGDFRGFGGAPLDTVVNIGIGGSDLGPVMATEALRPYHIEGRRSFFVSNIDGTHLSETLRQLDPARTLFVIASKTFTTQETMTNAASARRWFLHNGGTQDTVKSHFVALSTNQAAVREFGIDTDNMFPFWDWVGGRYSLWSAIGLSIALQIGFDHFDALLAGARDIDQHFRTAAFEENLPVLLALVGVWNRNFLGCHAHAVLPYDQYLHRLPAYLQQADMESNGKNVTLNGARAPVATAPVLFGEAGTNGQHAFYQLIHQGTDTISTDFIAPARSHNAMGDHHAKLLANFLAQPEALMRGKTRDEVTEELTAAGMGEKAIKDLAPHKVFEGSKPATSILMRKLAPRTLGALIALYEHKIFCQGVIWGINSFDQWGVELGKTLAGAILPKLDTPQCKADDRVTGHDSSTIGLIKQINRWGRESDDESI